MRSTRVQQITDLAPGEFYTHMVEVDGAKEIDATIAHMKRNSSGAVGKAVQRVEQLYPERKFETNSIVTCTPTNRLLVGTTVQRLL